LPIMNSVEQLQVGSWYVVTLGDFYSYDYNLFHPTQMLHKSIVNEIRLSFSETYECIQISTPGHSTEPLFHFTDVFSIASLRSESGVQIDVFHAGDDLICLPFEFVVNEGPFRSTPVPMISSTDTFYDPYSAHAAVADSFQVTMQRDVTRERLNVSRIARLSPVALHSSCRHLPSDAERMIQSYF
jgi:hypothetical protein